MKNYISIGKLVATHGVKGTMVLKHHLGKKTALKGLSVFFIEDLPGAFLPYFPVEMKARSESEILIDIEGVQTKEKAATLMQKQVWLAEEDFSKYADTSAPITLLGFRIFDKKKDIGEVLEVIEQPHQVMCRIAYEGNDEILIPINEQSLVKLDKKNKRLYLDLPDGLIESQL
jgi:16S rRNA processing protein RimM